MFDLIGSGKIQIEIDQRTRLPRQANAHADLAARKTTGSTVLLPDTLLCTDGALNGDSEPPPRTSGG